MVLVLPTAEELRAEQNSMFDDMMHTNMKSKDSAWCVKFKDSSDVEPADVHGA